MIENEALRALVTDAIFKSIDEKKRDELLKAALSGLLEPKRDGYSYENKSQLQRAFDDAVYHVAREIVKEHVTTNAQWRAGIQKVVNAALDRVMADDTNRDLLITNVAAAISKALTVAS